ncbi:cytochrome-c peroxidase [Lewinella sp. W8]|uniref:cytochrome-c peroxidase n=1 Tax=Lewinella sp. W8 TaxID=2528208 RepID=UPI001067A37A|nr:cytochrome c peroxidase [Lewinella sp. W8]MTB51072.1 cytochrome-c peroxidase [Lewinella sp. W8]
MNRRPETKKEYHLLLGVVLFLFLLMAGCLQTRSLKEASWSDESLREAYAKPVAAWPQATLEPGVDPDAELAALNDVPHGIDRNRRELGKQLFFDPILSASNQISCASCHDPDLGWGDGRGQSFGHDRQQGKRNAPTLLNVSRWEHFFWDGRAASLEEQVFGPIQDHLEMNQDLTEMEQELNAIEGYRTAFREAYGVETITRADVATAIADFERTIRSRVSRVDRFINGQTDALTDAELRGLHLFRTKARCLNCHHGPLLSDQQFHNSGQHLMGRPQEDFGRFYVTQDSSHLGQFRTPTLRDVAFTGPYLHHGNIQELREVLTMYNSGMPQIISRRTREAAAVIPVHDPLLQPLGLKDQELNDLLAFLEALSVRPRTVRAPEFPRNEAR